MAISFRRTIWALAVMNGVAVALLGGCAGNGLGLDPNGNPQGSAGSEPLAANFQSIQDNVFTPICTRCHSGAGAPEGLQLDQAHSYALLVGVPSAEVGTLLRVNPADPTDSYLIQKLEGSSGIVGAQMPFGGPYLPQSTIDVIRQWIANGAAPPMAAAAAAETAGVPALMVVATMPSNGAVTPADATIAVALSRQPDVSFLNGALRLQRTGDVAADLPILIAPAQGNPATVLLTPLTPLAPGTYRVTLRGSGAAALTAVDGAVLPADYSFEFTVESP
jgi:hypothetical protein